MRGFYGMALLIIVGSFNLRAAQIMARGGTRAQIQEAIGLAKTGDTVRIPEGTFNFDGGISMKAGITIFGAGRDKTVLKKSGNTGPYTFTIDGSNGERVRISGMSITGSNPSLSPGIKIVKGCRDFRIDNITFKNCYDRAIEVHDNSSGVIDHNIFLENELTAVVIFGDGAAAWSRPYKLGTADAVYIEDNYFEQKNAKNPGMAHHVASNNGSKYVFRYNTAVDGNLRAQAVDAHGNKFYWPRGSRSYEIYHNKFTVVHRWLGIRIRGGDGVIFNNEINGDIDFPIDLMHEGRSGDGNCSYPCEDQIRELYLWDNTYNGKASPVNSRHPSLIKINRDYFLKEKPGYVPFRYPHPLTIEGIATPVAAGRWAGLNKGAHIAALTGTGGGMKIKYLLAGNGVKTERVEIRIYNAQGCAVSKLMDERVAAGEHEFGWNGLDKNGMKLSPGVYTIELRAGKTRAATRITLFR